MPRRRRNGNGGKRAAIPQSPRGTAVPLADVIDHGDALVVRILLPGVSRENVDISVTSDSVAVQGRRTIEQEAGTYLQHEREPVLFARTLDLPVRIDAENTHAHLENGVLEMWLPKLGSERPRHVEIH